MRNASATNRVHWDSIASRVADMRLVMHQTASLAFFNAVKQLVFKYHDAHTAGSPFAPKWRSLSVPARKSSAQGRSMMQTAAHVALRERVISRFASRAFGAGLRLPELAGGSNEHGALLASMVADTNVRVVLGFHAFGGGDTVMNSILQGGFAALSKLDAGFYGQGLYFTTDLLYALGHYGPIYQDTDGMVSVLVCALAMGQPYPVIEPPYDVEEGSDGWYLPTLRGQPVVPPHDCHVVFVDGTQDAPKPAETGGRDWEELEGAGRLYSEVVMHEKSQVLPLAVLRVRV
jgi:hypothetical protein